MDNDAIMGIIASRLEKLEAIERRLTAMEARLQQPTEEEVRLRGELGKALEEIVALRADLEEAQRTAIEARAEVRRIQDVCHRYEAERRAAFHGPNGGGAR